MSLHNEEPMPHPSEPVQHDTLRAERDTLRRRLAEAEQIAEDLAEELGQARARLAEQDSHAQRLPLFDDAADTHNGLVRPDEPSDKLLLPIALAATAVVVFLFALLSLVNNGPLSFVSIASLVVAGLLARAAWVTRVVPVEVRVDHGVVVVRRDNSSLSFDLTSDAQRLEVVGTPSDPDWRVRFYRRGLEPCDVDASMVDPGAFLEQVRRYRPAA